MTRKIGRPLALFALTAAVLGTALGVLPFAGPEAGPREAQAQTEASDEHQLSSLRLFNRVILLVRDHYVETDKFRPRQMLLSALDYVEKRVAEVLVDERDALQTGKIHVTVGGASKTFDISKVDSLWDMSFRLKDIFAFVEENLVSTEDTREIEYAAVNGALATLDPHSNLLPPEQYADMKMHTRGEFGGLGFVVSMRDGKLTVMKLIKDTPAHRGGIKARDVITRIEGESTVNMDLTEAVKRLRGKPGSQVSFWVERDGFAKPRKYVLTREQIAIESIDPAKLLAGNVGYVRITNFQGNTTRDLRAALDGLAQQAGGELEGVVLDLRNNPGGLLDQAVKVADLFIEDGTIVSTVGAGRKIRERSEATRTGTLKDLPLVVLVNQHSASASEIVSGAIRHMGRGVVVGDPTFGKGSVQVLYDLFDDSALKLTIAEYLTAGDISIQQIGVTPDIALQPALVSKKRIMVFAPREMMREADLEQHMQTELLGAAPGATPEVQAEQRQAQPSPFSLSFLRDDVPEDEEIDEFIEPEWKEDFHVRFARDLIADAGAPDRAAMLEKATKVIEARRKSEQTRIDRAIAELGVDWRSNGTAAQAAPAIQARLATRGQAKAGETVELVLTVTNEGSEPLERVHAWTESNDGRHVPYSKLFDNLEFVFGRLEPGASRDWTVPVEVPADLPARVEPLSIHVSAAGRPEIEPVPATLAVEALPKPRFAFTWSLDDAQGGNGDGRLSPGEEGRLVVAVRNVGEGAARETIASLKNLEDEKVYISKGRHRIGALAKGAQAHAPMVFDLKPGFSKEAVRLSLAVFDLELSEIASDEIAIPVVSEAVQGTAQAGAVEAAAATPIHAWAAQDAPVVGRLEKGGVLPATHEVGGFVRVRIAEDMIGFVPAAAVRKQGSGAATPRGVTLLTDEPPVISLNGQGESLVTDAEELPLSGLVTDATGIRDLYVFLNNQKVYFKAFEGEGDPRLSFETDLPLDEGLNTVVVFARENDDLLSRKTLMVYRRPAAMAQAEKGSAQATPPSGGSADLAP